VDIHPDAAAILRNFISNRKSGFLFQSANTTMFDPRNIAGIALRPFSKRWAAAKRGRSSTFSGASVKSCYNEAMHGKS
jgi:hypothetical protein